MNPIGRVFRTKGEGKGKGRVARVARSRNIKFTRFA